MKYKVIIRPEAEDDLKKAFSWYEEKRKGLGYDFMSHVDSGLSFIEKNPEMFPPEFKETRRHLIKKFPYKIVYLIKKENIIVLAVVHGKRDPKLIKKRIKDVS